MQTKEQTYAEYQKLVQQMQKVQRQKQFLDLEQAAISATISSMFICQCPKWENQHTICAECDHDWLFELRKQYLTLIDDDDEKTEETPKKKQRGGQKKSSK